MMGETQHRRTLQAALRFRPKLVVGLAAFMALGTAFLTTLRRQTSSEWPPYSNIALAENKAAGKSTAVLYYARWTVSADPKGGLGTPTISRSLTDAGFVTMDADLTDSDVDDFRELKKQGFDAVPVLVLYPVVGRRVAFDAGTSESEIVSTIEKLSR